ncbi:MAG: hypothetical protein M1836_002483 [Candelina mexicana]|nr:MAG: hypothetical protein M1836_002483 [Candelina mexicana]
MEDLEGIFDDHPSLSASLEDFEHNDTRSPVFAIPSQHSGFKSEASGSDSSGPWSPPAWRRTNAWQRDQPYQEELVRSSPSRSREPSPQYESATEGDTLLPANVRLPATPLKRSPSPSPFPEDRPNIASKFDDTTPKAVVPESTNNYMRFSVRAEVQQRTEPFEAALSYLRQTVDRITKSRSSTICAISIAFVAYSILRILLIPPSPQPVPDLVKVAGLAKAFEPLIYYSENGVHQIGDLQETGVAVWDLGESVRSTNMTSAPIIVRELDDLSESLKTLAIELTKFFANVDGDVDGILIVMEWAKRELTQVSSLPLSPLSSVFTNAHSLLCRVGLFETTHHNPTPLGKLVTDLFGPTLPQRTRRTLQRTFNEFLSVLEESIAAELSYSTALFGVFESIDRQFLNLQRSVIRESDAQDRSTDELLSSLWTRVLGPNASLLRKYEKNKLLLSSVRAKTVQNKHLIVDHNGKLLALKANLETLRKKLVSPLVRSNDSSTLSVDEQIHGLDGTYEHLRGVREKQKVKLMEMLYGKGQRRVGLGREESLEIEGRK